MNALYALCAAPVGLIMDAVLLVALIVFALICRKRGFINMIFHFASGLVALIVAISLAKVVVGLTGGLFGLLENFTEKFTESFSKMPGFSTDLNGQDAGALMEVSALPSIIITLALKKLAGDKLAAGQTLGMLVGETVAELLCNLIAAVALFLVLKILFKLLRKIFTAIINKIKLLGKVNKFLGMILGILEFIFIISLVMSILTLIPSEVIMNFFQSSIILRLLYKYNPIVWLLGLFL